MISDDYKAAAAAAIFSDTRSELFPQTWWLSWLDDTGTELGARLPVANSSEVFGVDGLTVVNISPIDGGVAGASWTIQGVGFFDAEIDGLLVWSQDLPTPLTPDEDEPLVFDLAALVIEVV